MHSNIRCDSCEGGIIIQKWDGISWVNLDFTPIAGADFLRLPRFKRQFNLEFLDRYRRWCPKCGKGMKFIYI